MLKGGSKEERTNERTGVNPDDGGGARGNQEADRSTDAMRTAKAVRFVHIEKSSINHHHPFPSFNQSFVSASHFVVPSVSAFHSFRRFPRSMIIDPSLHASCILVVVVAHRRRPRRRSSSSSVVASHAPERECSSIVWVRSRRDVPPEPNRGNSFQRGRAALEWAWERESVPFFWVITHRF